MGVEPRAGLKEGKKRTNGLNAPTLIILGAKKDAPDRPISPAEDLDGSASLVAILCPCAR